MMQYGVFVYPIWMFRRNHGGEWGFTVGDGPNDDVPTPLRMSVMQSSIVAYQLLSQPTMFPPGSRLHEIVASCYGNGLKALKMILQNSHPAFVDEPYTLVTNYPKQKELSLLEYKMNFEDFLQLRAMISGHAKPIDEPGELDVFITNMKYRDHVQRVARDERRQAALQYKYKGDQLLETLNAILMTSDSPARQENQVRTPPRTATTPGDSTPIFRRPPRSSPRTRNARVNALNTGSPNTSGSGGVSGSGGGGATTGGDETEEYVDYDDADQGNGTPPPFTNYDEAFVHLVQIEIPDTESTPMNMHAYDMYRKAVFAISQDPDVAYRQRCIVCSGQHRFENCTTLNDHDFLKQHYIRFCQNVRRDQAEIARQNRDLNFIDHDAYGNESDDDDDDANEYHGGTDFYRGGN